MVAEVDKARNYGLKSLFGNKEIITQRALKQKLTRLRERKIT